MKLTVRQVMLSTGGVIFCIGVWMLVHFFLLWNGGQNQVFNWPDANANFHFAYRVFKGEPFVITLPFEASDATSYLATRSTRVIGSSLIPIGFWGLPVIYGFISRLLFLNAIVYLGIFVAAAGAYAWYRILLFLFSKTYAAVGTILLLIHPGWFYYTNETLLPNVLLVSLVLGTVALLFEHIHTKRPAYLYYASCLMVLCAMVRPSEFLWIAPLLLLISLKWRSAIAWRHAVAAVAVGVVLSSVWFIGQYAAMPNGAVLGYRIPALEGLHGVSYALHLLTPFGFNVARILGRAWQYGIAIFWPFTVFSAIGVLFMFRKPAMPHAGSFLLALCVVGGILLTHYGSGDLANTPNPSQISIDTSFVRYFLPIYILALPFATHGLITIAKKKSSSMRTAAGEALIFILSVFSLWIAVLEPVHGIMGKTIVLKGYDRLASFVVSNTPADALVVTEKGDKYIWPNRLVMVLPKEEGGYRALNHFAVEEGIPSYLVSLQLTAVGRAELNATWKPYGVAVGDELMTQDDIGVYAITVTTL